MKVVIAGATGFVGGGVLQQALQNPAITSVIALSRRPLEDASIKDNPKLSTVVLKDFGSYPSETMAQLEGADACIWAIGGLPFKFPNREATYAANVTYPLSAARAFAAVQQKTEGSTSPFRFVYVSGAMAENDLKKPLWYMTEARRNKGEIENALFTLEDDSKNFESLAVRPGMILGHGGVQDLVGGLLPATSQISIKPLSAAILELARNGNVSPSAPASAVVEEKRQKNILDNKALAALGRSVLETSSEKK